MESEILYSKVKEEPRTVLKNIFPQNRIYRFLDLQLTEHLHKPGLIIQSNNIDFTPRESIEDLILPEELKTHYTVEEKNELYKDILLSQRVSDNTSNFEDIVLTGSLLGIDEETIKQDVEEIVDKREQDKKYFKDLRRETKSKLRKSEQEAANTIIPYFNI